jgi:hypothetical protein
MERESGEREWKERVAAIEQQVEKTTEWLTTNGWLLTDC